MATYYITDSPDVDWTRVNWDNLTPYKHRHQSSDGHPVAQAEFDRRCEAGLPSVLWSFTGDDNPPEILDRCNL
jgi:hypothetical protein